METVDDKKTLSMNAIFEEVRRDDYADIAALVDELTVDVRVETPEVEYLLERRGVKFSPKGNVMMIQAEKKAGKSWLAMSLCGALLAGRFLGMEGLIENAKVVYFDTEQDIRANKNLIKRINAICGWEIESNHYDRFRAIHLREKSAPDRFSAIMKITQYLRPDMVVIDGVRDMLKDFNDVDQSGKLTDVLMELSSRCQCAVWGILHQNPGGEKMRGHLGTELGNKAEDILRITKKRSLADKGKTTYLVEEIDCRSHIEIDNIEFRIDNTRPYGLPVLVNEATAAETGEAERKYLTKLMRELIHSPESVSRTELTKRIKASEHIGTGTATEKILEAEKLGIITLQVNNKFIFTAKSKKAPEAEMPFEKDNEVVPF